MKPVFSFFILITLCAVWGCEPEDNTLVVSSLQGHTLQLTDHITARSIGEQNHRAVLSWDGKTVSDQNVGFPLQPEQFPGWVIQSYDPEPASWTVYVSPSTFTRTDFDQLVRCYEAKRTAFDSVLTTFPGYSKPGRIGRIVYGEAPRTLVFRTTRPRYETGDTEAEETFTIQPDGNWFLQLSSESNGMHSVTNAAYGKLVGSQGKLSMEAPLMISHPTVRVRADRRDLSDLDYLQSFTDSTGKPLLDVMQYSFQAENDD